MVSVPTRDETVASRVGTTTLEFFNHPFLEMIYRRDPFDRAAFISIHSFLTKTAAGCQVSRIKPCCSRMPRCLLCNAFDLTVPNWCSNGMSGYQDLDVCCLEACGQCGGAGCGAIPGTPGGEACCSNTIRESGSVGVCQSGGTHHSFIRIIF